MCSEGRELIPQTVNVQQNVVAGRALLDSMLMHSYVVDVDDIFVRLP